MRKLHSYFIWFTVFQAYSIGGDVQQPFTDVRQQEASLRSTGVPRKTPASCNGSQLQPWKTGKAEQAWTASVSINLSAKVL